MADLFRIGMAGIIFLSFELGLARADAIDDCNGVGSDQRIAGCTIVIADPKQSKSNLEAAYVARGNAYDTTQEYDKALADFEKATELDPKDGNARYNHGVANEHRGDLQMALKDYDLSLKLAPKVAETYLARGNVHFNLDKPQDALRDYQKALLLDHKNLGAVYGRGLALSVLGKKKRAIADFKMVIDKSQDEDLVASATTELEKINKKP